MGRASMNVEAKFHRELISEWPNFKLQCVHGRKSEAIEWNWEKPQFLLLNSWGIWEIWPSDEIFLILILVLENSDLELVEFEVIGKP
jgi:hypothetical protein